MGLFKRKKKNDDALPAPGAQQPISSAPTGDPTTNESEGVHRALDAYWASIGAVDPDVITYLINPMFTGSPAWPGTRQAYRVVRTPDTVIIASDGLSDVDPENPTAGAGFGCEVYIEAPALVGAGFEDLRASWQFAAIENFAQNVAAMGGISAHLRRYGVASMELPLEGTNVPGAMLTERGTSGALIGLPAQGRAPQVETPAGPVDIVPLTIVTTEELDAILSDGQAGRDRVAAARAQDGRAHRTLG